jgi:hypothetical protein
LVRTFKDEKLIRKFNNTKYFHLIANQAKGKNVYSSWKGVIAMLKDNILLQVTRFCSIHRRETQFHCDGEQSRDIPQVSEMENEILIITIYKK